MHVVPVPALADNYIWLLYDDAGDAIVVDPGEAAPIEAALDRRGLRLRAILLTHHHNDHIGGVADLLARGPVPVYAPRDERIGHATQAVVDGDEVTIAQPSARFRVLEIPGHTRSHIAYVGAGMLLCGDTLFSMGCGRLFEGTPQQMLASLDRLADLPGELKVCCAHEYTAANGRFAQTVEPANAALAQRVEQVRALREQAQPTLPVALATERATNPFLRVDNHDVAQWCTRHGAAADRVSRFAALRAAKDEFRA